MGGGGEGQLLTKSESGHHSLSDGVQLTVVVVHWLCGSFPSSPLLVPASGQRWVSMNASASIGRQGGAPGRTNRRWAFGWLAESSLVGLESIFGKNDSWVFVGDLEQRIGNRDWGAFLGRRGCRLSQAKMLVSPPSHTPPWARGTGMAPCRPRGTAT